MTNVTRAVRFYKTGGPEVLTIESLPITRPGPDEIVVRQRAIGINYIDTYYRSGLYETLLPSGLGFEGAGIVEKVGSQVSYVKPGDRVAYPHGKLGAYSEYLTFPVKNAVKLPDEISFETAAGMMLKGLTVQYLLRQIYPLKAGDKILFHAAAGGVGSIACQWARHLGIKLIGTAGSDDKVQMAKNNGAWEMINYSQEDVVQRVKDITQGQKVPVVFDSVGKATWEISLDCLSARGLMVSFGNASGPVTGVNLSVLAQKGSLYVTRPILGHFIDTHEKLVAASNELFDLVIRKVIDIKISKEYLMDDIKQAHLDLESRRTTGSSILIP
jgi:NADPH2:quinone reductase